MSEHKKEEIRMKARYLAQAYRIAIEEMPFKMQNDCCRDAIDQLAAVHIKATEMAVFMDRTLKCHCELAGEGIEYAWGCTKNHYRRQFLKDKRGKDNFRRTVRACFSRDVVTTERARLFSQRARAYMQAYHKVRQEQLTNSATMVDSGIDEDSASPVKLEKVLKEFKTHRCAMDFDSSFCKAVFLNDARRQGDTEA